MKKLTGVIDRLITVAAGLVLLAGGALALAWRFEAPWARAVLSRLDLMQIADVPQQQWWPAALAITAVASAIVAVLLLIGNLAPRRTRTASVLAHDHVAANVDLDALAIGVALHLESFPQVRRARGHAIDDRGTATIAVTVDASPHIDVANFTAAAEQHAARVAHSLAGAPVATRIQLHVDRLPR